MDGWRGIMSENMGGQSRKMYKGHREKSNGGRFECCRQLWVGWGELCGVNVENYT